MGEREAEPSFSGVDASVSKVRCSGGNVDEYHIRLKIDALCTMALAGFGGVGIAVYCFKSPSNTAKVTTALSSALKRYGKIGDITRSSLLVELHCSSECFLRFWKDYQAGDVKKHLSEEFSKIVEIEEVSVEIENKEQFMKTIEVIRDEISKECGSSGKTALMQETVPAGRDKVDGKEKETDTETSDTSKIPSELTCFIHALSPVKNSKNTNYFDCQLQTESGVYRAVCFSPEKRNVLAKYEEEKSPVKLSKFRMDEKEGSQDVIIQKHTNVIKAERVEGFEYKPLPSSRTHTISSLGLVRPGQLLSVHAKIARLSSVEAIKTDMGELRKQEAQLVDKTSSIKLILWEQEVESIEEGKTYLLKNIRMKESQGERYVNTAKNEKFEFEETEAFDEVVEVEDYQCTRE